MFIASIIIISACLPCSGLRPLALLHHGEHPKSTSTLHSMLFFHGDLRQSENPAKFLMEFNQIMCRLPSTIMDGEKIEALEDYLSTGSPADGWYKGLNSTQRTMWAALVTDFEKRWLPINFIRADKEATITKDDFCKLDALALESKRLPQSTALEAPVLLTSLDTFAHSPHLDLPPPTQTQTLTSFNTQSQQLYSFPASASQALCPSRHPNRRQNCSECFTPVMCSTQ
ncbi:hypothetical protein F4604DRAFT_1673378 [Suillus subluteus]|nr:hypothetical protein F4604DRAFT_1673378 [Suillus subluteus]